MPLPDRFVPASRMPSFVCGSVEAYICALSFRERLAQMLRPVPRQAAAIGGQGDVCADEWGGGQCH